MRRSAGGGRCPARFGPYAGRAAGGAGSVSLQGRGWRAARGGCAVAASAACEVVGEAVPPPCAVCAYAPARAEGAAMAPGGQLNGTGTAAYGFTRERSAVITRARSTNETASRIAQLNSPGTVALRVNALHGHNRAPAASHSAHVRSQHPHHITGISSACRSSRPTPARSAAP